ncbi:MAG: DUF1080 domain-containing protein [Chloroflexi bacterium]|nr:DUF1080 domain-containing protein [Chloroflexota bacterium]
MKSINRSHQAGQGMTEYSLLLVLFLLGVILVLTLFGVDLQGAYCRVVSAVGFANACGSYFSDDFGNLGNWKIVNGNWQTKDGDLVGGPGEGRIFHDLSHGDYTITVNGAVLNQGNGYGLWFRATNTSNVNGYTFQYDPGYAGGAFIMRKWVNGNELSPFAVARAPGYNWYGTSRDIQIVAKGSTFTAYVDGKPVLQGSDSTYTHGGVGFRTWSSTTARFGKISVDPAK